MPAYIILANYTDQGIKDAKNAVERVRSVEKLIESTGGRKIGVWWTLGQYDVVWIVDGPDEEVAFRNLVQVGMQGNARTITMRAFSEEETERILSGLP